MPLLVLLAICLSGRGAEAKYGGGSNTMASAETSTYVFLSDESAVVQTGGIAGVFETYSIEGQFRLIIDFDTGMASFGQVDANLVDESPFLPTQSLGELFNMAALIGNVVDETTIEFDGKTADGTNTDILLRLTFRDGSVHLTGRTVPPPNSADFFIYELDAFASKKYGGGTGEPNDPYKIATAEDLMLLGESPDDYDKQFILTADIDLDPNLPGRKVFDKAVIASASALDVFPWVEGTAFTGVFDGNGHTISHLTIVGKDYLGLFGYLESGAEVKNLGVVDVNVTGSGNSAGGLVGFNWDASITTSYSTGTVTGNEDVGGLVGYNWFGSITTSYSTGTVTGNTYVGGLVGFNRRGSITSSYSTGMVTGDEDVGGFVGSNYGDASITTSYSTGTVTGNSSVGGLVGLNWFGSISTSYSTGSVSGNSDVGGLVGYSDYGIIIITSFWDIESSGQATSAGGTGLTTAEMQDPITFMAEGWDFVGRPDGPHDIWAESEGGGYPILCWQLPQGFGLPTFSGGTGEADDPYRISTPSELNGIGHNPRLMDAYFELVNDIDLAGIDFYIIGNKFCPFTGSFNGNGHTISHMTIVGNDSLGLFGYLESGAEVKNLGVVDVNVTGSYYCGGLVGLNSGGSITSCYSTGMVSGETGVGGLVGINSGGSITTCYSTGAVSGNLSVGGLVGGNYGSITIGSITSSYSTGMVTGDDYVGGLVGFNFIGSSITTCYSTGEVSATSWEVGGLVGDSMSRAEVHNSFWDIETSGQTSSAGGTGKTTAEMQMASTFLDAGWDFVDKTANGTEDIWSICEGTNYPRLVWQIPAGDFFCPEGVTIDDFLFFIEHWREDNCDPGNDYCDGTDLDFSGTVDANDLEILVDNWLAGRNDY